MTTDQLRSEQIARPHYYFAHQILPEYFFRNPQQFISVMAIEDGKGLLWSLWLLLCEESFPDFCSEEWFSGVAFEVVRTDDHILCFIGMPKAKLPSEATAVGLTLSIDNSLGRYFTLELGKDDTIFFCEWRNDIHHNYGDDYLPEWSSRGFELAVIKALQNSEK